MTPKKAEQREADDEDEIARLYTGCGARGGGTQAGGHEGQVPDRGRSQTVHGEAGRRDVTCPPVTLCRACNNAGRGVKHQWFHECPGSREGVVVLQPTGFRDGDDVV